MEIWVDSTIFPNNSKYLLTTIKWVNRSINKWTFVILYNILIFSLHLINFSSQTKTLKNRNVYSLTITMISKVSVTTGNSALSQFPMGRGSQTPKTGIFGKLVSNIYVNDVFFHSITLVTISGSLLPNHHILWHGNGCDYFYQQNLPFCIHLNVLTSNIYIAQDSFMWSEPTYKDKGMKAIFRYMSLNCQHKKGYMFKQSFTGLGLK